MKILKFGGTSVGSVEGLQQIPNIISNIKGTKILVCSAMSGITDILLNLAKQTKNYNEIAIHSYMCVLRDRHYTMIDELFSEEKRNKDIKNVIEQLLDELLIISKKEYSEDVECEIITYGERLLTKMYAAYLTSIGVKNVLLDAREFMLVDEIEAPEVSLIAERLLPILDKSKDVNVYLTQGFIRVTSSDALRHLHRGGSDYSATLIGAALAVDEVQIWSDVDGFHNCDPRVVKNTFSIPYLSYDEAAELSYFGAKILHPQTVYPAKKLKIPLVLKDTFQVAAKGTTISNETPFLGRKAMSIKNDLMNLRLTFISKNDSEEIIHKIHTEFQKNNIVTYFSVETDDYVEVTVLQEIQVYKVLDALEKLVRVDFTKDLSIICIVGYYMDYNNDKELMEEIKRLSVSKLFTHSDILSTRILINSKNQKEILDYLNCRLFIEKIGVQSP